MLYWLPFPGSANLKHSVLVYWNEVIDSLFAQRDFLFECVKALVCFALKNFIIFFFVVIGFSCDL